MTMQKKNKNSKLSNSCPIRWKTIVDQTNSICTYKITVDPITVSAHGSGPQFQCSFVRISNENKKKLGQAERQK